MTLTVLNVLTGDQQVKNFSSFYRALIFKSFFITACYWNSLLRARRIQSTHSSPIPLTAILVSFSHDLFLQFPTKTLHAVIFPFSHKTHIAHFILLDFIALMNYIQRIKIRNSSLCKFLSSLVTSYQPYSKTLCTNYRQNYTLLLMFHTEEETTKILMFMGP